MRRDPPDPAPLVEGLDYTVEDGLVVFTARYLLRRGHCCDSGCRHCPYGPDGAPRRDHGPGPVDAKPSPR